MIRIRRWVFRLLLTVLVLDVSVPTAFLAIAPWRQNLPSGREGMPGDYARADALNIERFVLVGHSFGGGGTMEVAFAHNNRIAGLALLDPARHLATP